MNWLDVFFGAVIILHSVNGFGSGMIKVFFDIATFFICFLLSLIGSRFFSGLTLRYVDLSHIITQSKAIERIGLDMSVEDTTLVILGMLFLIVFFIMLSLLLRTFSRGFHWINRIPVIGIFNRLGGGVIGAAIGAAFVYIIIAALSLISLELFISALENSQVAAYAEQYASSYALELKRFFINFYISA